MMGSHCYASTSICVMLEQEEEGGSSGGLDLS